MQLVNPSASSSLELVYEDVYSKKILIKTSNEKRLAKVSSPSATIAEHAYVTSSGYLKSACRPLLLGSDCSTGILVFEWLDPSEFKSLEQEVLNEKPASSGWSTNFRSEDGHSGANLESILSLVGRAIGQIHNETSGNCDFCTPSVFLHGNLSPASIKFSQEHVAIVDAERAVLGDPALDVARMMAHLFVVCVFRESCGLLTAVGGFQSGYATVLSNLDKVSIFYRAGPLAIIILLDLVKSEKATPYLSCDARRDLSEFAEWWLARSDFTIGQVRNALWIAIDMGFNSEMINWRDEFASVPRA